MNEKNYSLGDTFKVALECELKAIASERRHAKRIMGSTNQVEVIQPQPILHSEEVSEVHVRNPKYKGKNYTPNFQVKRVEAAHSAGKQQQNSFAATNQYKPAYNKPTLTYGSNNNTPLSSSSNIVGEVTLKTSVDRYQLLKVNEMIKNAVAWRARMPKASKFSKYFNDSSKDGTQNTPEPKVHINEATLEVMGQAAKDFGYTEQEFVEAVEMYQYCGNQNLEDVPIPNSQDWLPKHYRPDGYYRDVHSTDKHFVDTCTIAVGPATGTVFPISSLGLKINALYDTGATKSCMSLKTFESLKLRLTKDRCPFVVTATGTSMEPIGFTECSFDINGRSFTQKFIVCNNQTRPIILGRDFASKNCIGVVWTKQGARRMIDEDCKVIMEVKEQTTDIPLSLTNSIRILPHTIAVAVVECATPLNSTMDIRADEGFLRDFPNIHVARSYVNDPHQSLAPNCIPFSFTNLSMYSQYLGKDKVVGFAQPMAEDVEVHALADHDEIAEMMRGPRNHIPRKTQAKYKMPIIPLDNTFITSPADVPGPRKVDLQDADITPGTRSTFDAPCKKCPKVFSKGNEDMGQTQLVTMDIDMGDSPPVSSRPYTLALTHHRWVQEEIETLKRAGVITKSMSPWASPIVVVPKKSQLGNLPKRDYVSTSEK